MSENAIRKENVLQYIKGVGPKRAETLSQIGIDEPEDLLFYFPRDYVRREAITSFKTLALELRGETPVFENSTGRNLKHEISVVCRVDSKNVRQIGPRKKLLELKLDDMHGGFAHILFWSYIEFFAKKYETGEVIIVTGKAELDKYGKVVFNHPEIEKFDPATATSFKQGSIVPLYKISQELVKARWSMKLLREVITNAIKKHLNGMQETLSHELIKKLNFPEIKQVVKQLHSPKSMEEVSIAMHRMKFEEVFFFELMLEASRNKVKREEEAPRIEPTSPMARKLYESLGFELTTDQKKVIREITEDMAEGSPMNRLLQGDVGSGKTIVAVLCMLSAIDDGHQVCLLAPTEILAEQHFANIRKYTEELGIDTVQLVGGQKKALRDEIKEKISAGTAKIICGTHAMFESEIQYNRLGLIVVDEQHRFGVQQRAKLKELAENSYTEKLSPHILVMSATPIPRTLSLTVYGDLDVSVIKTMPKGRKAIKTKVAYESQMDEVYEFIRSQVSEGRQAYIIYPLVEESDKMDFKAAVTQYEKLNDEIFPEISCGLLHGQMKWDEKENAMRDFLDKKYQILVSTTVIEVGIDVPNASVMLINDAERFGLATLHQLRGRVGRGSEQSYCILATKDHYKFQLNKRIDDNESKAALVRLRTMEETTDGFRISEVDLELRGPGDVLGTRQSGLPAFKFVDLARDLDIISKAKKEAANLLNDDPNLSKPQNKRIRETFVRKYGRETYLDIA